MLREIEHKTLLFLQSIPNKAQTLPILVCVSGGADSMVLLSILKTLRDDERVQKIMPIELAAIHFNHEQRGLESDADEALVREITALWKISLVAEKFSETAAPFVKGNFQEKAREWRYQRATLALSKVFEKKAEAAWLATAHHARDNAETVLLNIIRGTGVEGLQGIAHTDAQRKLLRPLLNFDSQEIRNYANEAQVPFREDSSNATTDYSRNLLRHRILPVIAELNPNFEQSLIRLTQNAQSVLQEIHIPEGPLPLGTCVSTTQILKLAKRTNSQLAAAITAQVLQNILHHARLASRQRPPVRVREVPLTNGWIALIDDSGLSFVKHQA